MSLVGDLQVSHIYQVLNQGQGKRVKSMRESCNNLVLKINSIKISLKVLSKKQHRAVCLVKHLTVITISCHCQNHLSFFNKHVKERITLDEADRDTAGVSAGIVAAQEQVLAACMHKYLYMHTFMDRQYCKFGKMWLILWCGLHSYSDIINKSYPI